MSPAELEGSLFRNNPRGKKFKVELFLSHLLPCHMLTRSAVSFGSNVCDVEVTSVVLFHYLPTI